MATQPIWPPMPVRSDDVPKRRSRPLRAAAISIVLVVLAAGGAFLFFHHVTVTGSGCEAAGRQAVGLDTEQAAIAATIAGVADERRLPSGAVTIAYAAAMQESHLHNLHYGDLDSVGVFQQRPSEGWGTRHQLSDPVYATGKFFGALVKVHDYLRIPVYQAAQDVQRSADGSAYRNYQQLAASLSGAFTGGRPHAVWCWFAPDSSRSPHIAAVRQQLVRTFGPLDVRLHGQHQTSVAAASSDPAAQVRVRYRAAGWAVASWLVTHAPTYGISAVRYAGYQWSKAAGRRGWTRDHSTSSGSVELRW
jgi:hypothetical protein